MTALLSPAMGGPFSFPFHCTSSFKLGAVGSMQSQMEAKLASIKSPGLKSGLPSSPTMRNFSAGNRQSLALDNSSNFLSPESAANPGGQDAAATLAQQRAKLKASNAAHRISAPVLASPGTDVRASWGPSTLLSQVTEQNAPVQEVVVGTSRPKSTEFSGTVGSPRPMETENNSWASMVNTPLIPMFKDTRPPPSVQTVDPAAPKHWPRTDAVPGVPRMGDPTSRRRNNKLNGDNQNSGNVYDDNGNPINAGQNQGGAGVRNAPGGWSGTRSPALSNTSSNRFGNDDNNSNNGMNGLGMQMGGFGMGLGSPTMGMGMPLPMSPFNMNMNMLSAMGISPEAQLLAAQMAASGFGQQNWLGMQPMSAGLNNRRNGPPSGRSPGLKSASSVGSRMDGNNTPKAEEDVDPALLTDIPGWLRSLRLHKYTPNFEGSKWQDMVMMDEAALEAKGVAALGARRKMLKTFELVRKKMGMDGPPSSVPPSATLKSP
jgi:hypothetical protein